MPTSDAMASRLAGEIAAAFARLPRVTAVAIAGSRAAGPPDEHSDIDLYVYAADPLPLRERAAIASRFASRSEVGNVFWEPGDEWIDARSGTRVDVMYRSPAWIEAQLERVLIRHEASLGYSTCFWHNILRSRPLFDRNGWYGDLQAMARRPYPDALQRAIIARNHPILRQTLSSYLRQIERAVHRGDSVSVQHRVTALLASYFDVLFAVNRLPHPGEKSMLSFALARCEKSPPDMETAISDLLAVAAYPANPTIVSRVNALLDGLDALLERESFLPDPI